MFLIAVQRCKHVAAGCVPAQRQQKKEHAVECIISIGVADLQSSSDGPVVVHRDCMLVKPCAAKQLFGNVSDPMCVRDSFSHMNDLLEMRQIQGCSIAAASEKQISNQVRGVPASRTAPYKQVFCLNDHKIRGAPFTSIHNYHT